MVNFQEIQTYEEKIDLNEKIIITLNEESNNDIRDNGTDFIVQMNLFDDTFSIKIKSLYSDEGDESPYININNKNIFENDDSILNNRQDGFYRMHYSMLNATQREFNDLEVLGMGLQNRWKNKIYFFATPVIEKIPRQIKIPENKIIHIKTINKIKIHFKKIDLISLSGIEGEKPTPETSLFYNHLFLVPHDIDYFNGNEYLFDVYMENDENEDINNDCKISEGVFKSSAIRTNQETFFQKKNEIINPKIFSWNYIGGIKLATSHYYNFQSRKVEKGFSENSLYGDIVPYDFSGEYKREYVGDFNARLKDITFQLTNYINQPVLNPDTGKVQLNINQNYQGDFHQYYILPWKNISLLRDQCKKDKDFKLTLKGLREFSHELKSG